MISKIAHIDWPDTWQTLFNDLMSLLKSGQADQVHGATRVLTEFIRDDITDQHFPFIAPVLLPELYSIFKNPNVRVIYPCFFKCHRIIILRLEPNVLLYLEILQKYCT